MTTSPLGPLATATAEMSDPALTELVAVAVDAAEAAMAYTKSFSVAT